MEEVRKRRLIAVDFPGYIKNLDKALLCLGGEENIKKVSDSQF